tara:strand:- start:18304 stop:19317 length:1014 start_codon:yes stop_codon:yes gene_type:complete
LTSHGKLLEALIRHQIYIQQYAGGQVKRALPILRQLARDLRARIAAASATEFQAGRMVALERDLREIIVHATTGIQGALELEDFAEQEAGFAAKLLASGATVEIRQGFTPEQIRAITTRSKMTLLSGKTQKRLTIRQAFDDFAQGVGRDSMRVVQAGVLEGKTTDAMAREVSRLVTTRSRQQAEAVIRTATNHVGATARDEVYRANADILEGERFMATLDSHTTITCAGLDRTLHPLGQGPRPPLHYRCRSIRVPEVKEEYRLGGLGERASMDGPVDNQLTYGGFLRRQSKEFQDDVLGPRRAALFRSGKVKINRFTDDAGRVLTLDQLAAREGLTL